MEYSNVQETNVRETLKVSRTECPDGNAIMRIAWILTDFIIKDTIKGGFAANLKHLKTYVVAKYDNFGTQHNQSWLVA